MGYVSLVGAWGDAGVRTGRVVCCWCWGGGNGFVQLEQGRDWSPF